MSQNHTRKPTRKNAPPNPKAPISKHLAVVNIVILYYIEVPWSLQIAKIMQRIFPECFCIEKYHRFINFTVFTGLSCPARLLKTAGHIWHENSSSQNVIQQSLTYLAITIMWWLCWLWCIGVGWLNLSEWASRVSIEQSRLENQKSEYISTIHVAAVVNYRLYPAHVLYCHLKTSLILSSNSLLL